VQLARRDAGLAVSDRIGLLVDATGSVAAAVDAHRAFIAAETLATSVEVGPAPDGFAGEVGDGESVRVAVAKA
jgi:isoleucyl-tRNA synthetase